MTGTHLFCWLHHHATRRALASERSKKHGDPSAADEKLNHDPTVKSVSAKSRPVPALRRLRGVSNVMEKSGTFPFCVAW